jgi:hypothetical protein
MQTRLNYFFLNVLKSSISETHDLGTSTSTTAPAGPDWDCMQRPLLYLRGITHQKAPCFTVTCRAVLYMIAPALCWIFKFFCVGRVHHL